MRKTKFFFGAMLLALALSLASCMKYGEDDFLPITDLEEEIFGACLMRSAGGETSVLGDTIKAPSDFVIKFWVDSLPELAAGKSYVYRWSMGDGTILYTPRVEHKYSTGLYELSVEITVSDGSAKITKTIWLNVSPLHGQDNIIMLLSSSLIAGGWDYELALLASTISGFVAPPYTTATTPWATGTISGWEKLSLTDFRYIEGRLYIIGHFFFPNYTIQEFHFGQGTAWSYGPNSPYWVSLEAYAGKYIFYPLDGKIYNFPVKEYLPGEDGDTTTSAYQATVRDSVMLRNLGNDSLRLFINYECYSRGPYPFISYTKGNSWVPAMLNIIYYRGWGYCDLSIANIVADGGRIYFRFGPNYLQRSDIGDMSKSKYFISPETNMCGFQVVLVSTRSTDKRYRICPI